MARKSKNKSRNPYIVVFWEGESEQQYFMFLKDRFHEKTAPMISTPGDKEKVLKVLADDKHCPGYKKGDKITIWKIAENYTTAIKNGEWSLERVKDELAAALNEDDKTKILYFTDSTFTNVHEVLQQLEQLIN